MDPEVKRKRGRPKGTTGRSWGPRHRQAVEQLLITADQCGAMANGISGQTWSAQCRKYPDVYPQPRRFPPASNRRVWVKQEVVDFLLDHLPKW